MANTFAGSIIMGVIMIIVGIIFSSISLSFIQDKIWWISAIVIIGGLLIIGVTVYKSIFGRI